jgi:hypothetical protein
MTLRSMLMRFVAAGAYLVNAGFATAQDGTPPTGAQLAVTTASAPVTIGPEEVQAFITTPNAVLGQFPTGGPGLTARIEALVKAAAAAGELADMMQILQDLAAAGTLSQGQISALAQGAMQAAATLAAAGNVDAQATIQLAVAASETLGAAAEQAAAEQQTETETAETTPAQTPTAPPTLAASPPGSAIGGGGASASGGGAGSSAGPAAPAAGGGGGTTNGGTLAGAIGGGGGWNSDDDDNDSRPVDTSPITRG